ncbi:MAG: M28 family metallopeptidase [Flavobacteriaceae bacterium]|nr:M28 family metallopeptidase [Flavobacteriaceae bacterium]
MKKITFLFIILLVITSCKSKKETVENKSIDFALTYANTITTDDVEEHVYAIASDEFEGRATGEIGQKYAAKYLAGQYSKFGVKKYIENTYYQTIPIEALVNKKRGYASKNPSENVIAFIEGTEKPNEILVISSHYDHMGIKDGQIYYGADDNASGTTAVLEIAQAFAKAKKEGHGPKRSIMFINFTGEERGLLGSKYFAANPVVPMTSIVANLNIDMIGRIGKERPNDENYVYVIGADRLSTELHNINEKANEKYTKMDLDYTYNEDDDPNRFYFRSDHYNFAKNGIPIIFYFNGVHVDYHKPTDTPDKINLELLTKRVKLVFYTAWEIANREERLIVDVK